MKSQKSWPEISRKLSTSKVLNFSFFHLSKNFKIKAGVIFFRHSVIYRLQVCQENTVKKIIPLYRNYQIKSGKNKLCTNVHFCTFGIFLQNAIKVRGLVRKALIPKKNSELFAKMTFISLWIIILTVLIIKPWRRPRCFDFFFNFNALNKMHIKRTFTRLWFILIWAHKFFYH